MMNHQKGKLRSAIENEFLNQKDPKVQAELSAMYELNQSAGFLGGVFGKKEKLTMNWLSLTILQMFLRFTPSIQEAVIVLLALNIANTVKF